MRIADIVPKFSAWTVAQQFAHIQALRDARVRAAAEAKAAEIAKLNAKREKANNKKAAKTASLMPMIDKLTNDQLEAILSQLGEDD